MTKKSVNPRERYWLLLSPSKQWKNKVRGVHLGVFWLTFDIRGSQNVSFRPPWNAFGSRPRKTTKESFFWTSFPTTFWYLLGMFRGLFFDVYFEPLSYQILVPKAPASLNFERLWVPFGSHSQQIWTNWNCDSVSEGVRKSSFGGLVFHLVSSFPCANCWDI